MSKWRGVAALYLICTLAYSWPILLSIGSRLPSDIGDPGLNAWILWWNSHAVPLTERWWNAPMFYPAPGAFALSETLLGVAPITIPMHLVGMSAVTVYNIVFILSIPASAIAAHALAHRLTARHDAAALAGAAFGFSPYRVAQTPHIQMELAFCMPLCLLALHRYVDTRRPRDLVIAGVCMTVNGFMCGYFLFFFPVLLALWVIWFARQTRVATIIASTLLACSLPLVPLLIGYHKYQSLLGVSRRIDEIEQFSADATSIWAASPLTTFARLWTLQPRPEGELYPGVVVLSIVAIASLLAWINKDPEKNVPRSRLTPVLLIAAAMAAIVAVVCAVTGGLNLHVLGLRLSLTRPHKLVTICLWCLTLACVSSAKFVDGWRRRSTFLFYTIAAVTMFAFALGPVGRIAGERFLYKAPYSIFMYLPIGSALRVPARFGMLFVLCLSQAAALGFARLVLEDRGRWKAWVLTAAILLDGWMVNMLTAATPRPTDLAAIDPAAIVIELPVIDDYSATAALLRQTQHRHPLANGFSGYAPPHRAIFETALRNDDPSIVEAFQQLGPVAMFVPSDRPSDRAQQVLSGLPEARRIRSGPEGDLYELPWRRMDPVLAGKTVLAIESIQADGSALDQSMLQDGNVSTKWEDPSKSRSTSELTLTLAHQASIDGVQLGLTSYGMGYPRKLRIEVAPDSGQRRTVWEGRTAGMAMLAVLADYRTPILSIPLAAGTIARHVVLTATEQDPVFPWSVAEVRVTGTTLR